MFVTFVDPTAAFYQVPFIQGLALKLNNRRPNVWWSKDSDLHPPTLALSILSGMTGNMHVGNIEDFDPFSEERLSRDFGEHGGIELVNLLKEK